MPDPLTCPTCGKHLARGSTFCINCGTKIESSTQPDGKADLVEGPTQDDKLEESILDDVDGPVITEETSDDAVLPDLSESDLPPPAETTKEDRANLPSSELTWDEADVGSKEEDYEPAVVKEVDAAIHEFEEVAAKSAEDVKEGMPFKEVEPPRVVDPEFRDATDEALEHLFPDKSERSSVEAVTHLFPGGRGEATKDFIDAVVGKPDKVDVSVEMPELSLSGDDFQYPDYVYEAMGKARIEHGEDLLEEEEHDAAIEQFEMAKKILEISKNEKMIAEARKKIDEGYEAKAKAHYELAERHRKAGEYEWAIVQYKKAREFYMFTQLGKMRAKCAEKVRDTFGDWGKELESDGDSLVKEGNTREALVKYKQASEKYTQADDRKKLRKLEKKIRKA